MPILTARNNKDAIEFIENIKSSGINISCERDVVERLGEAFDWKYAFTTLASNGKSIGIRFFFSDETKNIGLVRNVMDKFGFSSKQEQVFEDSLAS